MLAYLDLLDRRLRWSGVDEVDCSMDLLAVEFGRRILEVVSGRVSTEVDARLSFDTAGTIEKPSCPTVVVSPVSLPFTMAKGEQ